VAAVQMALRRLARGIYAVSIFSGRRAVEDHNAVAAPHIEAG
jgi:hypothetical protein